MKLKFCGCGYCRVGMKCKHNQAKIRSARKGARRQARMDLLTGREPKTQVRLPYFG